MTKCCRSEPPKDAAGPARVAGAPLKGARAAGQVQIPDGRRMRRRCARMSCPTGLEARADRDNRAWHSFQGGREGPREGGREDGARMRATKDNSDLDSDIAAAAATDATAAAPALPPPPPPPLHLGRSDGGNRGTRSSASSVARLVSE